MAILDVTEAGALSAPAATTIFSMGSAPLPEVIYIELADYCNLNGMFCGREAESKGGATGRDFPHNGH